MLNAFSDFRKRSTTALLLTLSATLPAQKLRQSAENATLFVHDVLDRCHLVSFVYREGNSGCNIFIPHIEGDIEALDSITQQSNRYPTDNLSHGLLIYMPDKAGANGYTSWRYTYGPDNFGSFHGVDLVGATTLVFYLRGTGKVEITIGGTNTPPYFDPKYPYKDGLDVRSTGIITLQDTGWTKYCLNVLADTFWVYKSATAGANNKFPVRGDYQWSGSCGQYMHVAYDSTDETGEDCIAVTWMRPDTAFWSCGGGFGLLAPNVNPQLLWNSHQGYDLTGLNCIRFKAKMTKVGKILTSFNTNGKKGNELKAADTVYTDWRWYGWHIPDTIQFTDVVQGFGVSLMPVYLGKLTPDSVTLYLDSIFYEGVKLKTKLDSVITGANFVFSQAFNPVPATVAFRDVYFDRPRLDEPRGPQSFLLSSVDSIFWSQQMTVHVYDAALALTALLAEWYDNHDPAYLDRAKKIGDFFLFAQQHDLKYDDGRLRNVYSSGLIYDHRGKARMAGYWNEAKQQWISDAYDYGTSTGNLAWSGIALLNLKDATNDANYLTAAKRLGDWVIRNTWAARGFTAGFEEVWDTVTFEQKKLLYTATEHCIDLYALFSRLHELTQDSIYQAAAQHADAFVKSMWDPTQKVFYTGTDTAGQGINTSVIPVDLQAWMPLAYRDIAGSWRGGYEFAKANMLLRADTFSNFPGRWLIGYDFSLDSNRIKPAVQLPVLDGIWAEGTGQMAVLACLYRDTAHYRELLQTLECMQADGPGKGSGIPAATINGLTTGFSWQYHYVRHSGGATCWYIFAKKGVNPYYCSQRCVNCEAVPLTATTKVLAPILCAGDSSGAIEASAQGGQPPISYSLNGAGFQLSGAFDGLPAGNYTITVKDGAGSTLILSGIELTEPAALALNPLANLNTINASASGGTGLLEFSLDGNAFQADSFFTGLNNGVHTVTVRDANGCTVSAEATVDVPTLLGGVGQQFPIACFGGTTALTVTASGGVPPYTYQLDSGALQSSNMFENISAGVYQISIRDQAGSSAIIPYFTVAQPSEIVFSIGQLGSDIIVTVDSGIPPFQYSLDQNFFQLENIFPGLPDSTYTIWVMDSAGCLSSHEYVLVKTSEPGQVWGLSITPNPSSGVFEIALKNAPAGRLFLSVCSAAGHVYRHLEVGKTGSIVVQTLDLSDLPAGVYECVLQAAAGTATRQLVRVK